MNCGSLDHARTREPMDQGPRDAYMIYIYKFSIHTEVNILKIKNFCSPKMHS